MAAAESKDAAVPPEGGPPPGEKLRLPAGEEAGRQMADYMRAIVDGYRRAPKDDLRIGVALARLECQTA